MMENDIWWTTVFFWGGQFIITCSNTLWINSWGFIQPTHIGDPFQSIVWDNIEGQSSPTTVVIDQRFSLCIILENRLPEHLLESSQILHLLARSSILCFGDGHISKAGHKPSPFRPITCFLLVQVAICILPDPPSKPEFPSRKTWKKPSFGAVSKKTPTFSNIFQPSSLQSNAARWKKRPKSSDRRQLETAQPEGAQPEEGATMGDQRGMVNSSGNSWRKIVAKHDDWLVVWKPLKNMSQLGWWQTPNIFVGKIKLMATKPPTSTWDFCGFFPMFFPWNWGKTYKTSMEGNPQCFCSTSVSKISDSEFFSPRMVDVYAKISMIFSGIFEICATCFPYIWRLPEMGVPPNHPFLDWDFPS